MIKPFLQKEINTEEYFRLLDEIPLWSAPFGLKLLEFITYKSNITALDIGFGTGFPLIELAMRLGNSSVVYGIDPDKAVMERVNKKINSYGIKNIKIIEGFAESIPMENESVDLITANNGINNVNDIETVISECARIIKKGGQFVMTMNLDKSFFEFYRLFEKILKEMELPEAVELMKKHIYKKRPPISFIESNLRKNGFYIKNIEPDSFNYKFADGSAMFGHFFIRLAFMEAWVNVVPVNNAEIIFKEIESRLNEKAKKNNGINMSIPFITVNAIKL
jgi:ubiquinone/menaquinone biosynthesis C-methylase UbiE